MEPDEYTDLYELAQQVAEDETHIDMSGEQVMAMIDEIRRLYAVAGIEE